jgi:hypothetical protein
MFMFNQKVLLKKIKKEIYLIENNTFIDFISLI